MKKNKHNRIAISTLPVLAIAWLVADVTNDVMHGSDKQEFCDKEIKETFQKLSQTPLSSLESLENLKNNVISISGTPSDFSQNWLVGNHKCDKTIYMKLEDDGFYTPEILNRKTFAP